MFFVYLGRCVLEAMDNSYSAQAIGRNRFTPFFSKKTTRPRHKLPSGSSWIILREAFEQCSNSYWPLFMGHFSAGLMPLTIWYATDVLVSIFSQSFGKIIRSKKTQPVLSRLQRVMDISNSMLLGSRSSRTLIWPLKERDWLTLSARKPVTLTGKVSLPQSTAL